MRTMTAIHRAYGALCVTALCVTAMTFAATSAAQATTTRSFVSSGGNDSNTSTNCAALAPCRTFSGAQSVTQSGGEIVAMNAGGYGPLTISAPLTITGTDGVTVSATTGTVGFTITAGSTDKVVIRGVQITGANATNSTGVQLTSGNLTLINCQLSALASALIVGNNSAVAHADIINTDFIGNTTAITTNGAGVNTSVGNPPWTGTQTLVRIAGGNAIDNGSAFVMQNAAGDSNQNCKNTIWGFSGTGNQFSMNVAGFTTFFSWTPNNPPFNCNIPTYGSSATGAPN
jgi:hypothetical protein